jgi:transcriptional regulator with XRE-family HTH domain
MATHDKKLFLGGRLKRLRRDLGVTQSRMAENLGVSASYLNLLERNQRPVTAQILLRLADAYDLDLRSLSADDPGGGAGLDEVLADKMFADLGVSRHEAAEVAELSPGIAEAMARLYRAYLDRGRLIDLGAFERPDGPRRSRHTRRPTGCATSSGRNATTSPNWKPRPSRSSRR